MRAIAITVNLRVTNRLALFIAAGVPLGFAHAHYVTEYWEAKVTDNACFVAVDASLEFFVDEDAVFGDKIEAIVSFVTPHPGSANPFASMPEFRPVPMHLNLQLLPSEGIRERDIKVTQVSVEYSIESVPLQQDPNWLDPTVPVYILSSEKAAAIWAFLEDGGSMTVEVTLGDAVNLRVPVQNDQFAIAAAMHTACVTEAARQFSAGADK